MRIKLTFRKEKRKKEYPILFKNRIFKLGEYTDEVGPVELFLSTHIHIDRTYILTYAFWDFPVSQTRL